MQAVWLKCASVIDTSFVHVPDHIHTIRIHFPQAWITTAYKAWRLKLCWWLKLDHNEGLALVMLHFVLIQTGILPSYSLVTGQNVFTLATEPSVLLGCQRRKLMIFGSLQISSLCCILEMIGDESNEAAVFQAQTVPPWTPN